MAVDEDNEKSFVLIFPYSSKHDPQPIATYLFSRPQEAAFNWRMKQRSILEF